MKKNEPVSVGMMSAMGLGVIVAAPAFGIVAPIALKAVVCAGCAWSANEVLKKITGRIPKKVEVKTPPVVRGWSVLVGVAKGGKRIYHSIAKVPHSKIAGVTGSGKTAFLMYIIAAYCMAKTPNELEVWIIDLKDGASFRWFEHFAHVKVFDDTKRAAEALEKAEEEAHKRNRLIGEARYRFEPIPWFKKLLIVVDEGAEMAPEMTPDDTEKAYRKKCHAHLSSIVRLGREPGVDVLFGTQRPSNEALPTHIRGQMDGTFCFRTENERDSEIALRHEGAEQLPFTPGRCLYKYPGGEVEIQVPFVDEEILKAWVRSGGKSDFIDVPYNVSDEADETSANKADRAPQIAYERADRRDGAKSRSSTVVLSDEWYVE